LVGEIKLGTITYTMQGMDKIKLITHEVCTIQITFYCKEIFHIPEPSQPQKYLILINL